jgi:hypothetical protein
MLKRIKRLFGEPVVEFTEQQPVEFTNAASIRQMKNGRYRLLENGNEVVATYARYRDALRGAKRRGLEVTDAVSA